MYQEIPGPGVTLLLLAIWLLGLVKTQVGFANPGTRICSNRGYDVLTRSGISTWLDLAGGSSGMATPAVPMNPAASRRRRGLAGAIAVLAWFALALQLYLTIAIAPAGSTAVLDRVANYFSYFTILTNLVVALTLSFSLGLPKSRGGRFFSSAATQAGTAVYIVVVGATYSLLLRQLWNPHGAQKLADVLLHDVVPVAYVLYWLILVPKASLRWKHGVLWLVYPVAYMVYTLVRGAATGWYPYPFVDARTIGLSRALGNGALMLLAFFLLGLLAVAMGRWPSRRAGSSPNPSA